MFITTFLITQLIKNTFYFKCLDLRILVLYNSIVERFESRVASSFFVRNLALDDVVKTWII